MSGPLERDEAVNLIGEGIHTALRKAGKGISAMQAYLAIDNMPADEWNGVLSFLVDALESAGVRLVRQDLPEPDEICTEPECYCPGFLKKDHP